MHVIVQTHYGWADSGPSCAHQYLLPKVIREVQSMFYGRSVKILDLGCGNGYLASQLTGIGHSVVAVDVSEDGIAIARSAHPSIRFEHCSIYDEHLDDRVGEGFDCMISLEVVEHLFFPKQLFKQSYRILRPGGYLIISTPYHGYLKNLAISLVNGWDRHFGVQWDGGHIKFFSRKTLEKMAIDAGFKNPRFSGVGRIPGLWKSMIMIAEK